jgi:hypothetical protein
MRLESAGHDQVDQDREDAGPEGGHVGQQKRQGEGTKDRNPDDVVAADPVTEIALVVFLAGPG